MGSPSNLNLMSQNAKRLRLGVYSGFEPNDTLRILAMTFHNVAHGVLTDTQIAGHPSF